MRNVRSYTLLADPSVWATKPSVIFHASIRLAGMNASPAPFVGLMPDESSNPRLNPFAP